jgi:Anti-sigma-D factor RsdA to sigma factor binding region
VRSGDIGDEAAQSADDADLPLDLAAVRADDDLIEALSAGLVPPPSGPRDPSDVEGELVALLAGWVADVRPESLLHPPGSQPVSVQVMAATAAQPTDEDEPLAAVGSPAPVRSLLEYENAEPVAITRSRPSGARAYLLRVAAGLAAIALIGSGVVVRSYDAHPGDSLWLVAKVVFPEKSRSVEAATVVSTALNTARVALESGRIDEARAAFQTVQDQLAAVDDADGRAELAHQRDYLTTQLGGSAHATAEQAVATTAGPPPLATGQAGATIPSSPTVTPGATHALLTPTSSPSVLAAPSGDPAAGSGGSSAVSGSSAPAVVAAPDPAVSAPPAVSEPAPSDAASGSSAGSPPPVAAPQAADPATNPPAAAPSPEPPAPTSAPADPATTVPSTPDPPVDNGGGGSGGGSDNTDNAANNSPAVAPSDPPSDGSSAGSGGDAADNSSEKSSDSSGGGSDGGQESTNSGDGGATAAASAEISVDGLAGSTLGAVTGVVASTTGTS